MGSYIPFFKQDSAVKGIGFRERDGRRLMVVEFQYAKNFWKDLTWAPTYEEMIFISNHLELVERYNATEKKKNEGTQDALTSSCLYPILHRERIQPANKLSSLPKNFYARAKKYIRGLRRKAREDPDKMREYEYEMSFFRDIVSARVKKIVNLAISSSKEDVLRNMQPEERELYHKLRIVVEDFRALVEP